jgi:crotonobetainyl-CoA:carnitine CoA-transferase CaiB-like acyl-CoA transferase
MTTTESDDYPAGALDGIRILDLSSVVSGPMAAVILADQGADVIKVEPPGWGDGVRGLGASRNGLSAIFSMINRNKRSIAINLKHPAGRDIVLQLAKTADVLLQNYRPGKMDKLGLGFDALKETNPNLIYTSINGMGEVGPYAGQKVYDYVIQGISGVLDAQAESNQLKMVRTIIYDKVTALTAAQGITAALFSRERANRNGKIGGQHLQLSMLDAGVYFNWPDLMWNYSFKGDGVQYANDLADMYEISEASDGSIVSHHMGADCSSYSTEELIEIFAQNEIPVAKANKRSEVATDPQVIATGVLETIEHPRGGTMQQPRPPVRFNGTPSAIRSHSPEVGQHTVEILSELGLDMDAMQALAQEGAIG